MMIWWNFQACSRNRPGYFERDIMKQIGFERRWLLKCGLGALLGLMSRDALADIRAAASGVDGKGPGSDGLLAAQSRLGENLIRYLAVHRNASQGGNLIVS